MRVVLDSFAVLKAIGSHKATFGPVDELVRKNASALLVARFKHKSLNLEDYRAICAALGHEEIGLFFETADTALLKAISKKCDPHADMKSAGDEQLRDHLLELAKGKAVADKPAKSVKPKTPKAKSGAVDSGVIVPHGLTAKPPR